jgi:aminoglycoside 6'-N-acetyltransferase I
VGVVKVNQSYSASSMPFTIRLIKGSDKAEYLRMRQTLWEDSSAEEIEVFFQHPKWTTFVAEKDTNKLCGFIEVGTRPYAEGCETSPVAFIEGWYIDKDVQRQGVGRKLVQAAEAWAKEQGFTEIASDTWLENKPSIAAHKALGFDEVERLVCFVKPLK